MCNHHQQLRCAQNTASRISSSGRSRQDNGGQHQAQKSEQGLVNLCVVGRLGRQQLGRT